MSAAVFAAVDIGASSGRVMLGRVSPDSGVSLETVHRFPNGVVELDGGLNATRSKEPRVISTPQSAIPVLVVPTDEERAIAEATAAVVGPR